MSEIKAGDTVRLKSGSPLMTVSSIGIYNSMRKAACVWFDGYKRDESLFTLESLVLDDGKF